MKHVWILVVGLALSLASLKAVADEGHKHAEQASDTPKSITGEVVDTGCYLGHEARGEKHVSCATKCIAGGMPMGLLTSDGALYLLLLNHDNPDPYNKLKEMAGKTVVVTGPVMARSGMSGIDVTKVELAVAPTSKK